MATLSVTGRGRGHVARIQPGEQHADVIFDTKAP